MSRTLSLLLPVHNAQAQLEQTVLALLDVIPELTPNFEVLIIDDGSSDDTSDTAQQLVARFPQIQLIRNSHRLGMAGAVGSGVAAARGEVILLREDGTKLELAHLGRL
ncbi:MAG: glycosyltransferase, partial [Planctomycetaceae bacterium]|nr:glycosyltransferase [Planctomycetaceae bacterium]